MQWQEPGIDHSEDSTLTAIVVSVSSALRTQTSSRLIGTLIQIDSRLATERALVGCSVDVLPALDLNMKPGMLFMATVSVEAINAALDELAADREPVLYHVGPIALMPEPCIRVPVSLLRELRGQDPWTDASRLALVKPFMKPRDDNRNGE